MQQIQTVTNERPRRAERVVPVEPSLRERYYAFIYAVMMLLLFVASAVISWSSLETSWGPAFSTLWNHSFLGSAFVSSIVISVFFALSFSHWRKLNKRRQQAARYTMIVRTWERATNQPRPDAPALPDPFVITSERNWPVTYFLSICGLLFVGTIGWLIYPYWPATLQAVQQGAPLLLVIINTCLNIAFVLCLAMLLFYEIVYAPRQQLIATREGLLSRRGLHVCFIPWQEARLFALISQTATYQQMPVFFYELASKDTIIRWPSMNKRVNRGSLTDTPSEVTLLGHGIRPSNLFPQQAQFLNIIVAERTGLQLYDLR